MEKLALLFGNFRVIGCGGIHEMPQRRGGENISEHSGGKGIYAVANELHDDVRAIRPREGFAFARWLAEIQSAPLRNLTEVQVAVCVHHVAELFVEPAFDGLQNIGREVHVNQMHAFSGSNRSGISGHQ